jgi:hypothetical protein
MIRVTVDQGHTRTERRKMTGGGNANGTCATNNNGHFAVELRNGLKSRLRHDSGG